MCVGYLFMRSTRRRCYGAAVDTAVPDELLPGGNVLLDHSQPALNRVPGRNRVAVPGEIDLPQRQTKRTKNIHPQTKQVTVRRTTPTRHSGGRVSGGTKYSTAWVVWVEIYCMLKLQVF